MGYFYPRSPCGERRKTNKLAGLKLVFLSTLSLRRATISVHIVFLSTNISIHALLAESDSSSWSATATSQHFYPRSPCGERPDIIGHTCNISAFLSTLSLRRATVRYRHISFRRFNFYPRSPCGERPPRVIREPTATGFLSTLSLRRATRNVRKSHDTEYYFYPRSPCGERRFSSCRPDEPSGISIHALLAESDHRFGGWLIPHDNFYPRSPCGERRVHYDNYNLHCVISIHALLAESDNTADKEARKRLISIHALLAESDYFFCRRNRKLILFLSTLSLRRATEFRKLLYPGSTYFYPRSPCGERHSANKNLT